MPVDASYAKTNMIFWHIQLHPDDKAGWPPERIKRILEETSYIGMGEWDEGERQIRDFCDELDIGNIVAVRSGTTPIALVEVIGEKEYVSNPNQELDWFQHRRKIKILDFYKQDYNFYIPKATGTFSICANPNAETSKVIVSWFNRIKQDKAMNDLTDILKSHHQVILTGAPGTGKTYLALQIAAKMIGLDKIDDLKDNNERFRFVQFHTAYDYTDFVEGLKPVKVTNNTNNSIGFERRDGVFMDFCKKAAKQDGKPCIFVIDEINRADLSRVFGELFFALESDYREKPVDTQYASLREENEEKQFYVPKNVFIIGTMNDIDRSVESIDFALRRRFAWYEVKADEDRFRAVMNGAALEDTIKEEAKKRYLSLNLAIGNTEELGESYQIGPAYFRKLEKYAGAADIWDIFWERHLELLIREYVRGWPKSKKDEQIKKFEAAYKLAPELPAQS